MIFPHLALVKATFYADSYYQINSDKIIKIHEVIEKQEITYRAFHNKAEKTFRNAVYLKFYVCGEEILRVAKFVFDKDEVFFEDVYPEFFQELTN